MRYLRQNTAVLITVGPFYDKGDGVTIETALTITNERITLTADTDDNNAPTNILDNVTGATSGTSNDLNYITGNDAGMMQLELSAANTNRVGRMLLSITDAANHVPVFHELFVLPAAIYDWFTGVIVPLPANVTQLLGTAWLTPGTAGTPDVNAKLAGGTAWGSGAITAGSIAADAITAAKIADGAIDAATFAAGAINAAAIASDAITDAKVASDVTIASVTGAVGSVTDKTGFSLSAAGIQAIWDALTSALTTVGSIGKWIVDKLDVVLSTRASQTSVDDVPTNAELATALGTADDATLAAIAALNNITAASVWDVATRTLTATGLDLVLIDGKTLPAAVQYIGASVAGKVSGAGTGTEVFKGLDGSTTRLTVTVDSSGNRSGVTYG